MGEVSWKQLAVVFFALVLSLGLVACDEKRSGGEGGGKKKAGGGGGGAAGEGGAVIEGGEVGGPVKGNEYSDIEKAEKKLDRLNNCLEPYKAENGAPAEDPAKAVKEQPGCGYNWPKADPWGEPYVYEVVGDDYKFFSKGPDKQAGTPDDILPSNRAK